MDDIRCSKDATGGYLIELKSEPKAKEEKPVESEPKEKGKTIATKSVLKASVCALLNSRNGGKFNLEIDDGEVNKTDELIRKIEQYLQSFLDPYTMSNNIEVCDRDRASNEITFEVEALKSLCTLKYNIYLPTDAQVLPVKTEEIVKKLLDVSTLEAVTETEANVPTFVQGRTIVVIESKTMQFKLLNAAKPTDGNDFGDRIISHDFTHCVSAFANCRGGLIFYGVEDDGIVKGTEITEKDKQDLTKKVSKYLNSADQQDQADTTTVNKMQWPTNVRRPQKGVHWDILFEPVKDDDDKKIPSTYVIVIFVAACPGGVFAKEPESYYIFDEKVGCSRIKPMTMAEWKKRLLSPTDEKREISPRSSRRSHFVRLKKS